MPRGGWRPRLCGPGAVSRASGADIEALRAHNSHLLRRRRGLLAILRRPESARLIVELVEQLIAEGIRGDLTDIRASAVVADIAAANPAWLRFAGGDRLPALPIRVIAGGRR